MVHQKRSSRKTSVVMDVSPLRNSLMASVNKHEMSSSPRIGYTLELPNRSAANAGGSSNQWHYNNMVNNNRQQFNNLHFC